jgi:hypothetical protein
MRLNWLYNAAVSIVVGLVLLDMISMLAINVVWSVRRRWTKERRKGL